MTDKWEKRKEPAPVFFCHALNCHMTVNESCTDCGRCRQGDDK